MCIILMHSIVNSVFFILTECAWSLCLFRPLFLANNIQISPSFHLPLLQNQKSDQWWQLNPKSTLRVETHTTIWWIECRCGVHHAHLPDLGLRGGLWQQVKLKHSSESLEISGEMGRKWGNQVAIEEHQALQLGVQWLHYLYINAKSHIGLWDW